MLIWEVRHRKGVSARELAKRTGISKSTIYNYEDGSIYPPLDKLYLIAKALGVEIGDLYDLEDG